MKKILLIFILTFIPFASHAGFLELIPPAEFEDSKKITKIKAIILACDSSIQEECYDPYLDEYINKSPIKFITRKNLKDILNEQTLSQSGLTNEKVAELGKLYSASHILFYKIPGVLLKNVTIFFQFKLVNTATSEIEYATTIYEYTKDYKKERILAVDLKQFFHILNINSAVNPEEIFPWRR